MRTKAVKPDVMDSILALLTRPNEVACRVALTYGLRIGDVLELRRWQVEQKTVVIKEQKTGKRRRITWNELLRLQMLSVAGSTFVFEHRLDRGKHRTRQAVYKDIQRAARALRLEKGIGTHSMRKSFAVKKYHACGDIRKVKAMLNHSSEAITILYALANEIEGKKR